MASNKPLDNQSAQKISEGLRVIEAAEAALENLAKRTGVTLIKQDSSSARTRVKTPEQDS